MHQNIQPPFVPHAQAYQSQQGTPGSQRLPNRMMGSNVNFPQYPQPIRLISHDRAPHSPPVTQYIPVPQIQYIQGPPPPQQQLSPMRVNDQFPNDRDNLMNSRIEQLEIQLQQLRNLFQELADATRRPAGNEMTFNQQSQSEIRKLRSQLDIKEKIIQKLSHGHPDTSNPSDSAFQKGLINQLENDKNNLEKQTMTLINELGDKDKLIRQLQQQIRDLQKNQHMMLSDGDKDQEIEQLQKALAHMNDAQNDELQRKDDELDKLRQLLRELQGENLILQDQVRKQANQLKGAGNTNQNLVDKDSEIQDLKRKLNKLESQAGTANDLKDKLRDKDDKIDELQNQLARLKAQLDEKNRILLNNDPNQLNQMLKDKDDMLQKFRGDQALMNSQLQDLLRQMDDLKAKILDQARKLEQAEAQNKKLKNDNDGFQKQLDIQNDEKSYGQQQMESQVKGLAQKAKDLEAQNKDLLDQLNTLRLQLSQMSSELQAAQGNSVYERYLNDLTAYLDLTDYRMIKEYLMKERDRTKHMTSKFSEMEISLKELQERVRQLSFLNSQMKEQIEFYEHEHQYYEQFKMKYAQLHKIGDEKFQLLMVVAFAFAEIDALRSRLELQPRINQLQLMPDNYDAAGYVPSGPGSPPPGYTNAPLQQGYQDQPYQQPPQPQGPPQPPQPQLQSQQYPPQQYPSQYSQAPQDQMLRQSFGPQKFQGSPQQPPQY